MIIAISALLFFSITFFVLFWLRKEAAPSKLDKLVQKSDPKEVKVEKTITEKLGDYLESAGIHMPVINFLTVSAIVSVAFFTFGMFFFSSIIAGFIAMLFGGVVIYLVVSRYRGKRTALIEGQMVTAVSLVASGMRAGASFSQAIMDVADEISEPIKTEFQKISRSISQGLPPAEAVDKAADMLNNPDLKMMATSAQVTSTSGGNLPEILDSVVDTIYDRQSLRSNVRAYTSEGRISGYVVGLIPIAVVGIIYSSSPDFYQPLLENPMGRWLLAGAFGLIFLGWFWISKIVKQFDNLY